VFFVVGSKPHAVRFFVKLRDLQDFYTGLIIAADKMMYNAYVKPC